MKIYSEVTNDKDEGIRKRIWFAFYFHLFCQDCNPTYPENHMQKGSPLFLQEIDYEKTNASND
jgi:hypothetical protein